MRHLETGRRPAVTGALGLGLALALSACGSAGEGQPGATASDLADTADMGSAASPGDGDTASAPETVDALELHVLD